MYKIDMFYKIINARGSEMAQNKRSFHYVGHARMLETFHTLQTRLKLSCCHFKIDHSFSSDLAEKMRCVSQCRLACRLGFGGWGG